MKYLYLEQNKKTLKMTVGTEIGEISYTHKYQYSSSDESCSEDDYIKNMLKEASHNDKKRRRSKKIKY